MLSLLALLSEYKSEDKSEAEFVEKSEAESDLLPSLKRPYLWQFRPTWRPARVLSHQAPPVVYAGIPFPFLC